MANARLKLARRRASTRRQEASRSQETTSSQTPPPENAAEDASPSQNERLTTAQSELEALEGALMERKQALETQLQTLTLGKPLGRETEPGFDPSGRRVDRTHRDFLLQEMEWMAADFSQERKWRLRNAKMLAQTLVSHLDRQEARLARQKKSEEVQRRRAAARVGREVKKFWTKIDKIIAFKVKLEADDLRQKHMQKHLKQLVEQTEKYSNALAASFQEDQIQKEEEIEGSREQDADSDFEVDEMEVDDETTIAEDEKRTTRAEVDEEMALLKEEGEMTVEELRERYAEMEQTTVEDVEEGGSNTSEDDDDFEMTEEEQDDETTIAAEERQNGPISKRQAAKEIATLQEESELSIEELRARYAAAFEEENDEEESSGAESEIKEEGAVPDHDGDGDFVLTKREELEEADDETTIEEEERQEGKVSPSKAAEEIRQLEEEGEMSIEELRARYATALGDEDAEDDVSSPSSTNENPDAVGTHKTRPHLTEDAETKELVVANSQRPPGEEIIAIRGGYKRPYLLTSRLDLREYQQAGVNWLISMCDRRINGILADEMGLGKTIQTISLLAHLACVQGLWGPHLIVVPTSCLVNWEMEFKRWCPAFKVLTYYGSAKRRKELRQGWSKQNAFQVCITSYQLVVQDAHCFKRKKWYYLILDEAHNIKNWKSLRWQTLLTFSSQRRLLLTGTPLQNNLLELWALMHFLMPHVFASRKEFTYWFQNPLALMVENGSDPAQPQADGTVPSTGGKDLVTQLHGIIRPFVLRRLKKDVAKQLPGKFEHVISCQLSKRQRFLYEDFISRSSTRRAMFGRGKGRGANFMSMMNVLMQLRKVCNHPDLFEPRPISSPLDMSSLDMHIPSRCGYLVDEIINIRPRVACWMESNLPGLELQANDKFTSKRRRQLFFYDVSTPLPTQSSAVVPPAYRSNKDVVKRIVELAAKRRRYWENKRTSVAELQELRVALYLDEPVYGADLIRACAMPTFISPAMEVHRHRSDNRQPSEALQAMVRDPEERIASLQFVVNKAICYVPKARARPARVLYGGGGFAYDKRNFILSRKVQAEYQERTQARPIAERVLSPYYESFKRTQLFFPDKALVQFDCGKLQQLAVLLRKLKRGGHRCLIFTQMSSMLNILEVFLNLHGHTYFRLDGATKVDKRQMLMERFNRDEKIFCFILSTRSGGLGINLTGADSVIFYDSDWNPAMDAQAQDRAHRIGQTRDVHIYRLVSEHTVEENILRKAQQKRHLDFLVMSEGQFTTDFFSKASLRELMTGSSGVGDLDAVDSEESEVECDDSGNQTDDSDDGEVTLDTVENAMAQLEDEDDVVAMKGARAEFLQEQNEFDEDGGNSNAENTKMGGGLTSKPSTPSSVSVSTATSDKEDDDNFADEDTAEDERINVPDSTQNSSDSENEVEDESHEAGKSSRKRPRRLSKDRKKSSKRVKHLDTHDQDHKHSDKIREKARDAAEEQKLQAWKASVSSLQGFEDSLNPVDRYALHFRGDIDPLYAYTPAQQAAALAGVDADLGAPTLLEDIERIEVEKQEEEDRLVAEGELVVGRMEGNDSASSDDHYTDLYRRERAHVLFERRKRLLTGAAWSVMKCANTGKPFYFNADTREATWDRPAVWISNEQLKTARTKGFGGLPVGALLRVLAMLTPYPERYRAQMVCHSWHSAAQNPSLFVKISASDFDVGSSTSLAKVLDRVARGDTLLFGAGVYQLKKTLKISKPVRLLAVPDSHVELQMHSSRAQIRWSARGGIICGFHFTRTSGSTDRSSGTDTKKEGTKRKRSVRKEEQALGNWQHLLTVVGDGRLRMEYCEMDGNGLGNACVCVWGRGEKKSKRRRSESSITSVPTPLSTTSAANGASGTVKAAVSSATVVNTTAAAAANSATATRLTPTSSAVKPAATVAKPSTPSGSISSTTSVTATTTTTANVGALSTSVPVKSTPEAMLVLQNCRIRGAGSSGVLLVCGSLVMSLNTVEGNGHSGVTVLGGRAVLRRNKIQRNRRFGLRLLYHAGHVVVEENVVTGNSCGNLDVDNSGRRFVVRWNAMDKGNTSANALPHSHGQVRLKTYRIVQKEMPRVVASAPKPSVPGVPGAYNKSSLTSVVASTTSTLGVSQAKPALSSTTSLSMMAAAMGLIRPTALQLSALSRAGLSLSSTGTPLNVSKLPLGFASLGAKPTVPSTTVGRPVASPLARPASTVNAVRTTNPLLSGTTTTGSFDPMRRWEYRPVTESVVVGGHEVILRDTCEKRVEKVVKPRRPKETSTPTATSLLTAAATPASTLAAIVAANRQQQVQATATKLASTPTATGSARVTTLPSATVRRYSVPTSIPTQSTVPAAVKKEPAPLSSQTSTVATSKLANSGATSSKTEDKKDGTAQVSSKPTAGQTKAAPNN